MRRSTGPFAKAIPNGLSSNCAAIAKNCTDGCMSNGSSHQPRSLPVLTFADLRRLKFDRDYIETAVEGLMVKLIDIEALRGAGRLYIQA